MFKRIAAATATVALALGLSLVAVAPANADEAPPATDTVTTDTPPVADPPAADPPAEDPPVADPPASDPPADDPPASDPPADDPPASDPPADDNSGPQTFSALNVNTDTDTEPSHAHLPVYLCHADPADTAKNGWISIHPDDDSVIKEGHGYEHDADIIPAFHYWAGSDKDGWTWEYFPGKNLGIPAAPLDFFGHTGQEILDNGCKIGLTAAAVAHGETCSADALVAGYITVTLDDHLVYSIDNGASFDASGKTGPLVTGGTYTVTVTVLAKYKKDFTVSPTSFVLLITAYGDECGEVGDSVAPAAAATNQICDTTDIENGVLVDGYLTVFTLDKISYVITADSDALQNHIAYDSVTGKTGPLPAGDYTIVPTALPTFELSSTASLHRTILAYSGNKCQLPSDALATPLAQKDPGCSAKGSYTLSNSLNDPAAIIWTVDGSTVAQGTYKVDAPATVIVHAAANSPTFGLNGGVQTDWTLTFLSPAACGDLKTLALTGTDDGLPMLAASGLLLLLGIALVRSGLRIRRQSAAS